MTDDACCIRCKSGVLVEQSCPEAQIYHQEKSKKIMNNSWLISYNFSTFFLEFVNTEVSYNFYDKLQVSTLKTTRAVVNEIEDEEHFYSIWPP